MATDEQVDQEQFIQRQSIDDPPAPVNTPPTPLPQKYSDAHLKEGEYSQFCQDTSYFTDEGLRVVMVAGAPDSTDPDGNPVQHEVVQVGKAITKIVITGTAERIGAAPDVPHWDLNNADIICLSHRLQVANPHQITNERQVYRCCWEYVYVAVKPITDMTKLPIGTSPAELEASNLHYFDSENALNGDLNDAAWLTL